VYHATITLKTAADKIVETNGVAHLEALVFDILTNLLNMSDTFVSKCDAVIGAHVEEEI
jgi:hypothetical protein